MKFYCADKKTAYRTSLVLKEIKRNANRADLEVLHGKAMNMTAATRAYKGYAVAHQVLSMEDM